MRAPRPVWILVLIVLTSVAMGIVSGRHRLPWSDEGWYANPAHNLAKHGFMGTTIFDRETGGRDPERLRQHTYWAMPLFILGEAGWYSFAPGTLFWTRMFSIAWIPVILVSFYLILAAITGDRKAALLATFLFGIDFHLVSNAGFARPDVMCAALGLAGLACYLALRQHNLFAALLLSNVFVLLSGLTHPNGLLHFAGLAFLVLWYDRHRLSWRMLAAVFAVYLAGGAAWGAYILEDRGAFLAQIRRNAMGNSRVAATLNPVRILRDEIHDRYWIGLGFDSPRLGARLKAASILCSAMAAFLILASRRLRTKPDVRLLLYLLALYFGIQCLFNQKLSQYFVHILPFYLALLSVFVIWSIRAYPRSRMLVLIGVALLAATQVGLLAAAATTRSTALDEREFLAFLGPRLTGAKRFYASGALLCDLNFDDRLVDDPFLGTRTGKPADVIIVDPNFRVRFDLYSAKWPSDWRNIETCLASYDKRFENPTYQVYFRRSGLPAKAGAAHGGVRF